MIKSIFETVFGKVRNKKCAAIEIIRFDSVMSYSSIAAIRRMSLTTLPRRFSITQT